MSREISIRYREEPNGTSREIAIRAPYYLFGAQRHSMQFWSLPEWQAVGVTELAQLGHTDPIYFVGWEMMDTLAREIRLFQDHFADIRFDADIKSWFLAHLVYCHGLLVSIAPRDSIPELMIG